MDAEAKAESEAATSLLHRRDDDDDGNDLDTSSNAKNNLLEEEIEPSPEEALALIGSVDVLTRSQVRLFMFVVTLSTFS